MSASPVNQKPAVSTPVGARATIPEGMTEVSKDAFFSVMGPRNVSPTVEYPYWTNWETPGRVRLGWSYPGWKNTGELGITPYGEGRHIYAVLDSRAPKAVPHE